LSFFLKDATYISENNLFELQNDNLFINASYKEYFKNNKWSLFMGSSYSKNKDIVLLDQSDMSENEELTQGKIIITNKINSATILKLGAEIHDLNICGTKGELEGNIDDKYYAGFIESEMLLLNTLALRLGFRHEYSDILNKNKLAPRISLAYKAGENCQLAIAYGKFYQVPENEFLYNKPNILNFENSTHYIANFQWMNNNRTFRIECFNKKYDQLIKNITELTNSFNNSGDGYARGVEVFWRDEKTIKNADYWISYSFLDTKRNYRDYPIQACPTFAAKHTLSIIYKQWISRISSMIGLSYSYSSGRPYYDPSKPDEKFHSDYTQSYKNLDINLSKMTTLWKRKAVIFFSFRNVLGQKHIFGYRYLPDGSGRIPIFPSSIRSFFLGCFISTY